MLVWHENCGVFFLHKKSGGVFYPPPPRGVVEKPTTPPRTPPATTKGRSLGGQCQLLSLQHRAVVTCQQDAVEPSNRVATSSPSSSIVLCMTLNSVVRFPSRHTEIRTKSRTTCLPSLTHNTIQDSFGAVLMDCNATNLLTSVGQCNLLRRWLPLDSVKELVKTYLTGLHLVSHSNKVLPSVFQTSKRGD